MFGINVWELSVLLFVGIAIFGPDRLPDMARQAARMLHSGRRMVGGLKSQLAEEMGPEVSDLKLRDLHPRGAVKKFLLDDLEEGPRRPSR